MAALRSWLDSPRPWRWAALLGALAVVPALGLGFVADDHLMRANFTRDPRFADLHTAPWDAFHFFPGEARGVGGVDPGYASWWIFPEGRARHFRPLTSLTHWLDFQLWPSQPVPMHLQAALWYALICGLAAALYRRLLVGWAAGLAALFYVVDFSHGQLTAWVANRNALISGALGLAALLLHARARADGRLAAKVAAPLVFAAALAAGEVALGAGGLLLAHVLVLEKGGAGARLRSLAPYVVVGLAWAAASAAGGFGVVGSGLYLDPRVNPAAFLANLPTHLTLALATELGGPGPDYWPLVGFGARAATLALAGAVVALALVALLPLVRRDATTRFFAVGALLATIPFCAAFPSSRLLLLPGFALVGLVARAFVAWREREPGLRTATIAFAVLAGGVHLVLGPPLYLMMVYQSAATERATAALLAGLPDEPALARQQLVIVNLPDTLFTLYLRVKLATEGRAVPKGTTMLGMGLHELVVERADERTLVVRDAKGFYGDGFSLLLRPKDAPMRPGERVTTRTFTAEVSEVSGGVPTVTTFRFAVPLEDPSLRWVQWDGSTLVPFGLPAPGGAVTLPARPHPLLP